MEFDPDLRQKPKPINRQPALVREEVRQSIQRILENCRAEESVDRLTDFVMLTSMEVLLVEDPSPDMLGRLSNHKLEALTSLNPETAE